jgi:phosphoserine phosphatase
MFRKKGLTRNALRNLGKSMKTAANLHETLVAFRQAGLVLGLISGGIDVFLEEALPDALSIFDHVYVNRLRFDDTGVISGVEANNFDFEGKVDALAEICSRAGCELKQAVFVGEGFNDMAVLRRAGLSIAFAPVRGGCRDRP